MTGSSENKQQGAREQRSGRISRYSLGVKVEEFEVEGLHENKCVAHDKFNWSDAVGYLLVTRCFYSYHCNLQFLLCAYFWRGAFLTSLFLSFVMRTLISILSFSTACFLELSLFSWFPLFPPWMMSKPALIVLLSPALFFFSLKIVAQMSYCCLKCLLARWKLFTSCQDLPFSSSSSPAIRTIGDVWTTDKLFPTSNLCSFL